MLPFSGVHFLTQTQADRCSFKKLIIPEGSDRKQLRNNTI